MYYFCPSDMGFYSREVHGDRVPSDAVPISTELFWQLQDVQSQGKRIAAGVDGMPVALEPTFEQLQAHFVAEIQARLDAFARTRNYDGILSACTYATSAVQKFQAEGQRAVELRDTTWAAAYTILDEVLQGTRPMPSSIADIEADLPALEWPQ